MNNATEYKVSFSDEAWTLLYEDMLGKFKFTFEGDYDEYRSKRATKTIFLDQRPIQNMKIFECRTPADRERIALILERVQQYLLSLGYQVKIV